MKMRSHISKINQCYAAQNDLEEMEKGGKE